MNFLEIWVLVNFAIRKKLSYRYEVDGHGCHNGMLINFPFPPEDKPEIIE